MDSRSSPPFTGKSRLSKPRAAATRKPVPESKTDGKELHVSRQRRAFGTVKNPNIPANTMPDKPIKRSISISDNKTEPKSSTSTNVDSSSSAKTKDNSTKKPKAKLKKKVTSIQKQVTDNSTNSPSNSKVQNLNEPQTPSPVASSSGNKTGIISTPYHSAENCSKCRFDRLETSSYWLAQIKLAESVSKHFVSACFFRLACESKAKPKRNLKNELKRYLVLHEHLSKETEWKELLASYGLFKDENSINALEQDQKLMEHDEADKK